MQAHYCIMVVPDFTLNHIVCFVYKLCVCVFASFCLLIKCQPLQKTIIKLNFQLLLQQYIGSYETCTVNKRFFTNFLCGFIQCAALRIISITAADVLSCYSLCVWLGFFSNLIMFLFFTLLNLYLVFYCKLINPFKAG